MSADKLLDRLPRVKRVTGNTYTSGCPAHGSRQGRPVRVTVLDDGRILLHAFCGCDTEAVLSAVSLTMSDLFPERIGQHIAPSHCRIPARDLLDVIDLEALTIGMIALQFRESGILSDEDKARLEKAATRIGTARDMAHGR